MKSCEQVIFNEWEYRFGDSTISDVIDSYSSKIENLRKQIDDLKCCMNCEYSESFDNNLGCDFYHYKQCDDNMSHWKFDGLKKDER